MNGAKGQKAMAIMLAVVSLASAFAFCGMSDSDAASEYYTYTINTDGTITGCTAIGPGYTDDGGKYTSADGTNVGSWGFDAKGYGPFGSFYAAFDPADSNRMVCHLNPNNLKQSVDGLTDITGKGYNIMWCLPAVYWSTDSDGKLVLTNDPSKGTAYAHTIDGKTYPYLAIGVYEASSKTVNDKTILTSESGATPLVSQMRSVFRGYANSQDVSTDGKDQGHAMLWNFYQYELYKYCALAVMGGFDSQSIAGNGSVYGTSSIYYDTPGLLDASGPYAGTIGSGTAYQQDSVKVFVENVWGSVYDFVDGIVFSDRKYCIDQGSVPDDSTTAGDYMTILTDALPSSDGWGSSPSTKAEIWGMPTATSGSATTGLYDYVYSNSGTRPLSVGGWSDTYSSTAQYYGLSCVSGIDAVSDADAYIGGRLSFVFAADPAATSEHTVSFISNGQTTMETVSDGEAVAAPENPVLEGKVFGGWYTTETFETRYNFGDKVESDLKLYARWVSVLVFTSDPTTEGQMIRV